MTTIEATDRIVKESSAVPIIVTQLVKIAKGKPQVTFDQMLSVPEMANDADLQDSVIEALATQGIEVVDDLADDLANLLTGEDEEPTAIEPSSTAQPGTEEDDGPSIYEGKNPKNNDDEFLDKIDDPVRMYLSQMGEIPLLSAGKKLNWPAELKFIVMVSVVRS